MFWSNQVVKSATKAKCVWLGREVLMCISFQGSRKGLILMDLEAMCEITFKYYEYESVAAYDCDHWCCLQFV